MNVKGIFGKNLKYYRKEKKLSQEQLSENVDITVKHLSEIERGIVFASAGLMEKLAKNLDIPIFAFFLTDNSIYYDNIMLARIEKAIIKNIEYTMNDIKKGIFNEPLLNRS
jgi:transcriptional regulator with XRE-family HTH domain